MGSWGSQGQLAGGYQSGRLQPRQFCQSIQRPILIASIEHGCMNSVHCTLGFSALERESLNVFDHRGDARSALPPDTQLLSQQHRFSQFIDGLRDEHGRHSPMMARTNDRVGREIRKTTVDECVNVDRRYSGKPVSHRRNYIGDKAAPNALLRPKPNIVGTHQRRQEFYDRAPWGLPLECVGADFKCLWIGECIGRCQNPFEKRSPGSIEDRNIGCIEVCQPSTASRFQKNTVSPNVPSICSACPGIVPSSVQPIDR